MALNDKAANFTPQLGVPHTGVVVTGGASGIGLATAHALAAVGRPVALWDIDVHGANASAALIADRYGVRAMGYGVDLRDARAVIPAAEATRAGIGAVGGIVHAAGTAHITGIDGVNPENWDAGIALHVRALVLITQAFRADLRANPGSAIVAISSISATLGSGLIPIYSAAKGAVLSLVRSMADELANDGIRINAVSPGNVDTPMMALADDEQRARLERRIMLGRYGRPEELARAIRFLLSAEASYITAAQILVDGGNINSQRQ